jgi:hypothetical protein
MNDNSIYTHFFENLNNNEKTILCKSITKIFAKRLLFDDRSKIFPECDDNFLRIEIGMPENLTFPGHAFASNGWLPDVKFKIFSTEKMPDLQTTQLFGYQKIVWLDIQVGEDSFVEREKREVMNFISKNSNQIVISCLLIADKNQSKLSLQFYLLQPNTGWKKLTKFFYSSKSDFNNLTSSERGEIGEALASIFAKRLLYENRSAFFPEFDKEFLRIEEGIGIDYSASERIHYSLLLPPNFYTNLSSWEPDATFQILTNPDVHDLKYEFFPKKIAFLEAKTGKNSRFERSQQSDAELYNRMPNIIVLFCQILPENSESKLALNFKIMKDGRNWETIKTFYYSDF